ncbi:hypothetical protein J2T05_000508 [Cupriavidus necator]|nr:hypothetical protein [Cupriavidus necator]
MKERRKRSELAAAVLAACIEPMTEREIQACHDRPRNGFSKCDSPL